MFNPVFASLVPFAVAFGVFALKITHIFFLLKNGTTIEF